jgi:hypothetical protein
VRDQVSHPYKATGKVIILYIFIFRFQIGDRKLEYCELNGGMHSSN